MGAQRHIDGHAGAHVVAQHFNDFTHCFGAASRALGQFDHYYKAHARAHNLFRRDKDIEAQAAVVRHYKADASVGEVAADNLPGFRHQYADNARFAAPFAVRAQRLCQHLVAVDTGFHLLAGEIEIVFAAFDTQKTVAIAVANNNAFQQVETFG